MHFPGSFIFTRSAMESLKVFTYIQYLSLPWCDYTEMQWSVHSALLGGWHQRMHPLGSLSASSVGHFFAPLRIMLQKQCLHFGMGTMSFAFFSIYFAQILYASTLLFPLLLFGFCFRVGSDGFGLPLHFELGVGNSQRFLVVNIGNHRTRVYISIGISS